MPIATPDAYAEMLDKAKQGAFAYPAINVSSSQTLNAALAGFAGGVAAPLLSVQSGMGDPILILTLVVIVLGGVGSSKGAFLAAIFVSLVDAAGRTFIPLIFRSLMDRSLANAAGPAVASMLIYCVMAIILAVRPGGLFAFAQMTPLEWVTYDDSVDANVPRLILDYFGMHRYEASGEPVGFNIGCGDWIRLFRRCGFTVEDLVRLYDSMKDREMREQLIFVYSQRREDAALDKLFDIGKNDPDRELRKKAIFWIGQSRSPRAAKYLQDLINQ